MSDTDRASQRPGPGDPPDTAGPATTTVAEAHTVIRLLDTVRASSADTGDAATQHDLDATLVCLEDVLLRLGAGLASGGAA